MCLKSTKRTKGWGRGAVSRASCWVSWKGAWAWPQMMGQNCQLLPALGCDAGPVRAPRWDPTLESNPQGFHNRTAGVWSTIRVVCAGLGILNPVRLPSAFRTLSLSLGLSEPWDQKPPFPGERWFRDDGFLKDSQSAPWFWMFKNAAWPWGWTQAWLRREVLMDSKAAGLLNHWSVPAEF